MNVDNLTDNIDLSGEDGSISPPKVVTSDKTVDDKSKDNYVDRNQFNDEICKFYDTGIPSDNLGKMLYDVANGLSHRPNFINYSFRDEMVSDAMVNMLKALNGKKFDVARGYNPFSYFTCVAFHTFCTRIKKEKKHRDAIEAFQEEYYPELMDENRKNKKVKSDE